MSKTEVIFTEESKTYEHYGYEEFVRKAINKCCDKKEHGLVGTITIFDAEVSKRIYLKNENGEEFTIRYFLQDETETKWGASYTLYKTVWNEDGSGHGEAISGGNTTIKYILTPEDIIQNEIKRKTIKQIPTVTSAKVTNKASCMNNTSCVDFIVNNVEEDIFTIRFYNKEPVRGMIYPHPSLYKYKQIPKETEEITKQILNILKETNQSLWDDRGEKL